MRSFRDIDFERTLHTQSEKLLLTNNSLRRNGSSNLDENSESYRYIRDKAFQLATLDTSHRLELEHRENKMVDAIRQQYIDRMNEKKLAAEEKENQIKMKQEEDSLVEFYADDFDSDSTVITMSYNANLIHHMRFIKSLRSTGFNGIIIIGIEASTSRDILNFLSSQNVTIKTLVPTECIFESAKPREKCYMPYPHIKRQWSHYPLIRDWLIGCSNCTGPVFFIDSVKRAIFQKNPFGMGAFAKTRLTLYEHHRNLDVSQTTDANILKSCRDIDFVERMFTEPALTNSLEYITAIIAPFIASGSRDDIIDYTGAIYSGIRELINVKNCRLHDWNTDVGGAIVNHLRTEGHLPVDNVIFPHRFGEVNNALYDGTLFYEAHQHIWKYRGLSETEAEIMPYEGSDGDSWIDSEYLLTDKNGDFMDAFFRRSTVITDYDSFGKPFLDWLDKKLNITVSGKNMSDKTDDLFINGENNSMKASKEKVKVVLNQDQMTDVEHKSGDRINMLQNEEANGMYYPPEKTINQAENDISTDDRTEQKTDSNLVPVVISNLDHPSDGIDAE